MKIQIRELALQKAQAEGRDVEHNPITQKEIAQATGINEAVLSRYANGFSKSFQSDILERLMDYFDVSLSELVVRE